MTTALSGVPRVNGEYQGYVNGLTNGHASKISKQHMNGNSQPILDGRSIHQNDDFTNEMVKEKPMRSPRDKPVRVVCIGAGAAGICLAVKLPRYFIDGKMVELQIYEKNPDVGGCWYENTYPGCACDIPAHVYSYGFEPNPDWSHFYAGAPEIQRYFRGVADKYNAMPYIKLSHKVVAAYWDERGQWDLRVEGSNGEVFQDYADVLINASGLLNSWKWPKIPGLETFQGPRLHSANWDSKVDFTAETTVAVIGNGSSAIQIVPKLQPKVKNLKTFVRTKTWIALPFTNGKVQEKAKAEGRDGIQALIDTESANPPYSEEERRRFREDPAYLRAYRKEIEHENNARFAISTRRDSPAAIAAIPMLQKIMKERMAKKPELHDKLIPNWNVGCRRLTPGVGYLETLCEENVDVIFDPIKEIVPEGIVTSDGKLHKIDVLVCATGFDVSSRPHFDAKGRNGFVFSDEWAKSPRGYMSLAQEQMPNYFVCNGANAPLANGSLIPALELLVDHYIKWIEKFVWDDIRSFCIKTSAVEQFTAYVDAWMPRSIWASNCRSWYKGGSEDGRVAALWPGSINHFIQCIERPRWEDYDYTYLNPKAPFGWMGNGLTLIDVDPNINKADYLDRSHIDA